MSDRLNLAVLISGRGSNLQSLIDATREESFPARISVVISNKPDAYGLVRAQEAGIPVAAIDHKLYKTREDFEAVLQEKLQSYAVDLICSAGFMRILTPSFVLPWEGRMVNIHPSLLPDFKGLHPQAQALAAGVSQAGCSVHYVIPGVDEGPVIIQRRVDVLPNDTEETLSARILEQEHLAYPEAVRMIANGKVVYQNGRAEFL